jgi:hypothetical protein
VGASEHLQKDPESETVLSEVNEVTVDAGEKKIM